MVGRSELCPCGSGKKYKRCCGANAPAPARQAAPAGFPLAFQLYTQRRFGEAEQACTQALAREPQHQDGWFLLAACALEQQAYDRALAAMQQVAALAPKRPEVHFNLGHVHERSGNLRTAITAYQAAVALAPDYAQAWDKLGNCLKLAGRLDDAIAACREGTRLAPQSAAAWNNLGVALKVAGHFDEAASAYERALACDPRYAPAHNNLGNLLALRQDYAGAEARLREALRLDADFADAHLNLGGVLRETGRFTEALAQLRHALRLQPQNTRAWIALVGGLQGFRYTSDDAQGRRELAQALAHPAIDPLALVPAAASLLKHAGSLKPLLEATQDDLALHQLYACADDTLLGVLLESAVIADWELEAALRRARAALLGAVGAGTALTAKTLQFAARLAAQCLLTDYVYLETPAETAQVDALQQRLDARPDTASPASIAVYACYRPLRALAGHARLRAAPELAPLLRAQLDAPREEAQLRAGLQRLGAIEDEVSRAVQAQYEEHPYPRWRRIGLPGAQPLEAIVRAVAPRAAFGTIDLAAPQVLVAGCGTGRHPIQTATRIAGARVLAVDLSSASLGYAMRKAHEAGADNLAFMQADILQLGALEEQFDLVESFGVLHHMREPEAGWRVLAALTKPGGLMLIGLYSERARAAVVACRQFVRARGYASDAASIRRFRQDLMREGAPEVVANIRNSPDFYSVSDCRDLIFHVQEHRYTLPQIAAIGERLGLACLGLELDDRALYAGLPSEAETLPAPDDLAGWDAFEQKYPGAFGSTYKIWWQKK